MWVRLSAGLCGNKGCAAAAAQKRMRMERIRVMVRLLLILALLAPAYAWQSEGIYRISPVRPVGQLRAEAARARPPAETGPFRPSDLVDLSTLDATIRLDIRYATADNFLSTPVYTEARALLQRPAAEAAVRAHRRLLAQGYGLVVHDAYRPWSVTWIFWEATPADKRAYVADPAKGSRHNRGCAIDVTLYELKSGRAVDMPSLYDEMTERAWPAYQGGSPEARRLRDLLRAAMEAEGFTVYENEWWHFDYRDWRHYRIENVPFAEIP
jgi:zinc D-Ala-D-Ala dipeptidase